MYYADVGGGGAAGANLGDVPDADVGAPAPSPDEWAALGQVLPELFKLLGRLRKQAPAPTPSPGPAPAPHATTPLGIPGPLLILALVLVLVLVVED